MYWTLGPPVSTLLVCLHFCWKLITEWVLFSNKQAFCLHLCVFIQICVQQVQHVIGLISCSKKDGSASLAWPKHRLGVLHVYTFLCSSTLHIASWGSMCNKTQWSLYPLNFYGLTQERMLAQSHRSSWVFGYGSWLSFSHATIQHVVKNVWLIKKMFSVKKIYNAMEMYNTLRKNR